MQKLVKSVCFAFINGLNGNHLLTTTQLLQCLAGDKTRLLTRFAVKYLIVTTLFVLPGIGKDVLRGGQFIKSWGNKVENEHFHSLIIIFNHNFPRANE